MFSLGASIGALLTAQIAWRDHGAQSYERIWRRSLQQSRGLPTLAEPFGGRSTTCERVRRFRSNQVLQERARTEHVVFPAENVSRRSGEQLPGSTADF